MSPEDKSAIQARFEALRKSFDVENGNGAESVTDPSKDEDVEMGDEADVEAEGGFTAVNHG